MTLRHIQTSIASKSAFFFETVCCELLRLRDLNLDLEVTKAVKSENRADESLKAQYVEHDNSHRSVNIDVRIVDEIHVVLSATEKNVDAILRSQKVNTTSIVAANERDKIHFDLFALKVVDSDDAKKIVENLLFEKRFAALE